jgi:hypothetical protein
MPGPTRRPFRCRHRGGRPLCHRGPETGPILFVEALGNERWARRRLDTLHATADFLERYAWRQTGLAHDRIGMVASHLLVGGLTELVVTWLDGRLQITLDELVEDAAALMVAVGAGANTSRPSGAGPPVRSRVRLNSSKRCDAISRLAV